MNKRLFKHIFIILSVIVLFFISMCDVKAYTLECQYEVYPINYKYKNGSYLFITDGSKVANKVIYRSNGIDDYEIIDQDANKIFKDNDFNKKAVQSSNCPNYIEYNRKGNWNITEITENKFNELLPTYLDKSNYAVMFLTNKNGQYIESNALKAVNTVTSTYVDQFNKYKNMVSNSCNTSNYKQIVNYSFNGYTSSDEFYNYATGNFDDSIKNDKDKSISKECWNARASYLIVSKAASNFKSSVEHNLIDKATKATEFKQELANSMLSYSELENNSSDELIEKVDDQTSTSIKIIKPKSLKVNKTEYELKCEDVKILHSIWLIMWIAGPIVLIVMLTLDFSRAVIASDVEKMKKARSKAPKRIIAALILVLTPAIITLIVNLTQGTKTSDTSIMYCIVNGGE